jgi:hypothetical protein
LLQIKLRTFGSAEFREDGNAKRDQKPHHLAPLADLRYFGTYVLMVPFWWWFAARSEVRRFVMFD